MGFISALLYVLEIVGGIAIPVIGTLMTLKDSQKDLNAYKKWASYWVSYALLKKVVFVVFGILPSFLSTIILFLRVAAALYLWLPQTNGSFTVWDKIICNPETLAAIKQRLGGLVAKYCP